MPTERAAARLPHPLTHAPPATSASGLHRLKTPCPLARHSPTAPATTRGERAAHTRRKTKGDLLQGERYGFGARKVTFGRAKGNVWETGINLRPHGTLAPSESARPFALQKRQIFQLAAKELTQAACAKRTRITKKTPRKSTESNFPVLMVAEAGLEHATSRL